MTSFANGTDVEYGFYDAHSIADNTAQAIGCIGLSADALRVMRHFWFIEDLLTRADIENITRRSQRGALEVLDQLFAAEVVKSDTPHGQPEYGDADCYYMLSETGYAKQHQVNELWKSLQQMTQSPEYRALIAAHKPHGGLN